MIPADKTASDRWPTAGEALARRKLKKEKRAGMDHFVTGQHDGFIENDIAYVTFVDVMGHAVNVPFEQGEDGEWKPVGVYQRAGQCTAEPIRNMPETFVISDAMRAALRAITSERVMPRRWTLWMDSTGQLRANEITPTFGGGGYVVVPEDSDEIPPWEPEWEPKP